MGNLKTTVNKKIFFVSTCLKKKLKMRLIIVRKRFSAKVGALVGC